GVVTNTGGFRIARDLTDGAEVHDLQQRIRRRLDPQQPRIRAHGSAYGREVRHIDVRYFERPLPEDLLDHFPQPVIYIVGQDDVIAWFETLQQARRDSESRREHERLGSLLEC